MPLCFLVCWLGACTSEPDILVPVPDMPESSRPRVSFSLRIANAPGSDIYDGGNDFENRIDITGGDFRFLFFSIDDRYAGELEVLSFEPVGDPTETNEYIMTAETNGYTPDMKGFKVVFIANWGVYPQLEIGEDISKLWRCTQALYDFRNCGQVDENSLIPFYGVQEFAEQHLIGDVTNDLGTIYAIRAYAKVEVRIPEEMDKEVERVVLTRVNAQGWKCPQNVTKRADYVFTSTPDNYIAAPHVVKDSGVLTDIPLAKSGSPVNGHFVYSLYLPEYDNVSPLADKTRIRIHYSIEKPAGYDNSQCFEDYLDFKYYADQPQGPAKGTYFDILRNYWYRYTVVRGSSAPSWKVDVIPFSEVILQPVFGLERDDLTGYSVVRDRETNKILYWVDNFHEKWSLYDNGKGYMVLAFSYPEHKLSHYFDNEGRMYLLQPELLAGVVPVYDESTGKLLYWQGDQRYWIVQTPSYSVQVYDYNPSGVNPAPGAKPLYWVDVKGGTWEMSVPEENVMPEWLALLKEVGLL